MEKKLATDDLEFGVDLGSLLFTAPKTMQQCHIDVLLLAILECTDVPCATKTTKTAGEVKTIFQLREMKR